MNGEEIEFTSENLKEMTSHIMSDYLYGDNAEEFEKTPDKEKRG